MIERTSTSAGGGMQVATLGTVVLVVGLLFLGTSTSQAQTPSYENSIAMQPSHASTIEQAEGHIGTTELRTVKVSTLSDSRRLVTELRLASGLTWEQLARLLAVTPRTLHFWASGKAISAAHEERLARVLATVRRVYRGSAAATRRALLSITADNEIPFDLLAAGAYATVEERLGTGKARRTVTLPPLSKAERDARRPLPPALTIGSLHGKAHRDPEDGGRGQGRAE